MPTPRAMLFVDGENLTLRFQATKLPGRVRHKNVIHEPDCYVWLPDLTCNDRFPLFNLVRVHYYTTIIGDEVRVNEVKGELANIRYRSYDDNRGRHQLVPFVFKKPTKSEKTRNIDIQIVIDIMRYTFSDEIDRVYLASGDGDYLPLITEVMRRGKQVELLAFSSGLYPALRYSVDNYTCLDELFFSKES